MQPMKNPASSIALRVATAMHQMGIEGLPRNYELVYEAYSGSNPDLVREFIALGKVKTQDALDALGRKYLPHHHEDGLLARHNNKVRAEMSSFISLLNQEKLSLTDYGRLIGDATKGILTDTDLGNPELSRSIQALKAATDQRVAENSNVVKTVVEKTEQLADVQREADQVEQAKFVDALTGMGSRRAFNKALAKVYANPALPTLCGLAVGEIDDFAKLADHLGPTVTERFIKQIAKVVKAVAGKDDLACRFDGSRFGLLFYTSDQDEISRIVNAVRVKLKATAVVNAGSNGSLAALTMSFGICLSEQAPNAFDLMTYSERALTASKSSGGDTVTLYGVTENSYVPKDWLIYKPHVV
ncbi:GGDEF domain-containing protein [Agrobacterium vitis]|uniref:Diguanylate cyclase n=1 Tax=Agrobacterium vitis TaxID=373 RepID=A0AAE4WFP6_AGRVI|nr:GGDEF domain-containing protein [Agrobacterium vitis]MCF1499718.1 GGDEF domain-containing protein [Allorhizobium sp. Av2]MCM2440786.1 GGDEF domain-containing protein [Agrobacterium vitis]MUZ59235.1 diguanylate cyclase [Agrobacterium vitis]MVA66884.1 diguanylate cyclase [Agrobacterium vitis]MVA87327.1 diguanylate cyclase [Agrobacterium vitis]